MLKKNYINGDKSYHKADFNPIHPLSLAEASRKSSESLRIQLITLETNIFQIKVLRPSRLWEIRQKTKSTTKGTLVQENYNVQCALHRMVLRTTFPSTIQTRIFVQLWDYDTTLGKQMAKPIYQIWKTKGEDILLQYEKKKEKEKKKRISNNLISTLLRCQEYIGNW